MRKDEAMALQDCVSGLIEHLQQGKILEAMDAFYAEDTAMQENANEPVRGLAANIEREKQFLASVKEWKGLEITASAVRDEGGQSGVAFIEYHFEFVNTEGAAVRYEQVSVQRWKDGRIAHERFYYNAGG